MSTDLKIATYLATIVACAVLFGAAWKAAFARLHSESSCATKAWRVTGAVVDGVFFSEDELPHPAIARAAVTSRASVKRERMMG